MNYVHITPEDALDRLLSIESLGDAMDTLLSRGPLSTAKFAKFNNALLRKHFPDKDDEVRTYYECVHNEIRFAGPEQTPMIVCNYCLEDVPIDEHPESEFVLLSQEPLPIEGLECEVCGQ